MSDLSHARRLQAVPTPRRLLGALLVGALVAGGWGATATAVDAAREGSALPPALDLPPHRIGDRGMYEVTHHPDPGTGREWLDDLRNETGADLQTWMRFEWRHGRAFADRNGSLVDTDFIGITEGGFRDASQTANWTIVVGRGGRQVVAVTAGSAGQDAILGGLQAVQPEARLGIRTRHCLLVGAELDGRFVLNSAAGSVLEPGKPFPIAGPERRDCFELPYVPAAPTPFHATGTDLVAGRLAVRWEAESSSGWGSTYWFAPGIAYPLRHEGRFSYGDVTGTVVTELVAFEPGVVNRIPAGEPVPAPEIELAPMQPWGLDEAGVEHPFPLSKAYGLALTDPDYSDLRDFMGRYPGAYASAAHYAENARDGEESRTWTFTVRDGDAAHSTQVAERRDQVQVIDEDVPAWLGGRPRHEVTTVANVTGFTGYSISLRVPGETHMPRADEVDWHLPTVASLLELWRLHAGPGAPEPQGWGFAVGTCADPCTAADSVAVWVGVERAEWRENSLDLERGRIPLLATGGTFAASFAAFNATGQAMVLSRSEWAWSSLPPPETPRLLDAPPEGVDTAPFPGDVAGGSGWIPSVAEAATFTVAGLLAAILYLVWPNAKAGGLALFSRLRPDAVLDHPQRQLILQAVAAQPGIHFSELRRRTGLANGTLVHHLRHLERTGTVARRLSNGYACYMPPRHAVPRDAAVKAAGSRQLLATITASPGLSNAELAQKTGLAPSTVHEHVQRLAAAGVVRVGRAGRTSQVWAVSQ